MRSSTIETFGKQKYNVYVIEEEMGCSLSGLNALQDVVYGGGGDVWINENRFRIVRKLGEGGFAHVFLVKELLYDPSAPGMSSKIKDSSHILAFTRSILEE